MQVTISIPDPISRFLESFDINIKKYAEDSVKAVFCSEFDSFRSDPEFFIDLEGLIEKFQLRPYIICYDIAVKDP